MYPASVDPAVWRLDRPTSPTGAVRLICRYAAAEGVTQGVIRVDPENSRSAAVARRSGFTYDKRVPEADGNPCDRYVRHLTADRVTTPRPR